MIHNKGPSVQALACAASVLLTGAEALSTRIETVEIQSSSVADPFVSELVCLRKLWKVKRIGQTITGSLGYQFGMSLLVQPAWQILVLS
jgi:hypothetical protein